MQARGVLRDLEDDVAADGAGADAGTTVTYDAGPVTARATVGDYVAVIPEVAGSAHVTGRSEFVLDPGDPLRDGFLPG